MSLEPHATLYRGQKRFLVFPSNRTIAGFRIDSAPFITIDEESAATIGRSVRLALEDSKADIPTPSRSDYPLLSKSRLQAAGVGSESAFMRGARAVGVTRAEAILLTRGFHHLVAKQTSIPLDADDTKLGEACLRALAHCE